MRFFTGLHQPSDAKHFETAFVSVNRLKKRKSGFEAQDWIMDSGAFTTILTHHGYPEDVSVYAAQIKRWATNGNLLAAVAQDYMCEAHMLKLTGKTVLEHQQLTIERYDALMQCDVGAVYIMPVLQGYAAADYVRHIEMYRARLAHGAWVGVGSVCKRNGDPAAIEAVLMAIKAVRPDLRLHGFGLKSTALSSWIVRELLHTADSMAWSYSARKQGRNGNDWREAKRWTERINSRPEPAQGRLFSAEDLCVA
jgi:GNAT superfamily N-acetyltransferase